jgi:putative peptidoglycan lipid II flippase
MLKLTRINRSRRLRIALSGVVPRMSGIISRLRHHLANPDSYHRRIAEGLLWVSIFVLLGKLAGAAKEMTIAWRYGVSATVDAYVFVFNLVNWPVSVWFSILTVVLVPLAARLRNDNPAELPRFRGELLAFTLLLGVGLGALFWFGLPTLLGAGRAGLTGESLDQALAMAGPLSLMLPLGLVVSLFSAWMMAGGRHRNTLIEAVPALVILLALLLPPGWLPDPLIWGTVAGLALQLAGLAWPLRRAGELAPPSAAFQSPAWRGFWGGIGIMAVGQVLMSFVGIIDQFFAADLGQGALSTLGYANRILALVLGMGATAIGRATLPVFSEAHANGGIDVNALAMYWAKLMFVLGMGALLIGWIAAPGVVSLLFERGAFTPDDTKAVTRVFRYGLVQVPFYASALTLVNLFAGQKRYYVLLVSGAVGLAIKVIAATALVKFMQLDGLVLSTAAVYCANALLFYGYTLAAKK